MVRAKSKMLKFSAIHSGLKDFGMADRPCGVQLAGGGFGGGVDRTRFGSEPCQWLTSKNR